MKKERKPEFEFFIPETLKETLLPLFSAKISAGFPSPAEDFIEQRLDLNKYLIKNPSSTFLVKVNGESMKNAGILNGDILIVDRSINPTDKTIILCVLNGEFTVKRISKRGEKLFLIPENDQFKPIEIVDGMDFRVWGVVVFAIHKMK